MADNTNPYGVDLAIDPTTGDLVVWPNGALGVAEGPENVTQAMMLWIKTAPQELALHPEYGSSFTETLVGGKLNLVALDGLARSEFKNILANDARFLSVGNIVVTQDDSGEFGPRVHVRATLNLTGGESIEVLDYAGGVFSTVADADTLDPSPVDPLDDPSFFLDDLEEDDLIDGDAAASAVEDLNSGVLDVTSL